MKKTDFAVEIVQSMCGRNDRIYRRVWTDGERLFVKVNGYWFDLYEVYGRSLHHTIYRFYSPVRVEY